jgi:hypothetical protein
MDTRETASHDGTMLPDAARMLEIFRANLRTGDGATVDVQGCTLDYLRQSTGRRIAQYVIDVADAVTQQVWHHSVTVLSYGRNRTHELWAQLRTDPDATTPVGTPPLQPLTYVAGIDALIQVFPYDRRLPGLAGLVQRAPAVTAAVSAALDHGERPPGAWDIEVIRYRPEMRATVRLTPAARSASAEDAVVGTIYAKVYRDEDLGARAHQILETLWRHTTTPSAGFAVPRPIGYLPEPRILLLSELPGMPLLDIVRDAEHAESLLAIRRAAQAVAELHQLPLPDELLVVSKRADDARLAEFVATLSALDPREARALDDLATAISARLGDATPPRAPTHYDLRLVHLLLDGDRVGLLDFDKMAWGNPLLDVAGVAAVLLGKERSDLAQAFLTEYFGHVPETWRERYPAQHALALLSEAASTGRGQRGRPAHADRGSRVASAVEQVRAALAARLW